MVISQNLIALTAQRQFKIAGADRSRSAEKLSSGYRINRSADDAAGLSISEKMRRQIRGLKQADQNVQDGISLVQTADGALSEVHDMLQRMNELCVKSANGTNTSDDRGAIQTEIGDILDEIDRIGQTTTFNDQKLFTDNNNVKDPFGNFTFENGASPVDLNQFISDNPHIISADDDGIHIDQDPTVSWASMGITDWDNVAAGNHIYKDSTNNINFTYTTTANMKKSDLIDQLNGTAFRMEVNGVVVSNISLDNSAHSDFSYNMKMNEDAKGFILGSNLSTDFYDSLGITPAENFHEASLSAEVIQSGDQIGIRYSYQNRASDYLISSADMNAYQATLAGANGNKDITFHGSAGSITLNLDYNNTSSDLTRTLASILTALKGDTFTQSSNSSTSFSHTGSSNKIWIQAGSEPDYGFTITLNHMSSADLGIYHLQADTSSHAVSSISKIKDAITTLSKNRSSLGAYQNRMEHMIKTLGNTIENTQSSESLIRDTNMADETVRFSNHNILMEAGQSMLAQANQSQQGILSLLK